MKEISRNMKESNSKALIVAYYLSRFDRLAYKKLGFKSYTATHDEVGRILGVNPNSVKNMRDEFDPLHENPRVGWYQRPLRPSRVKIVELFKRFSEEELREIVMGALKNADFLLLESFKDVIAPTTTSEFIELGNSFRSIRI